MNIDSIVAAVPPPLLGPAESRAQRLQRQQSRFRDRGGIFVPTARNTLVDILLGKSTAAQQRRSVSCSPVRVSKAPSVGEPRGISEGSRKGRKPRAKSGQLDEITRDDQPVPVSAPKRRRIVKATTDVPQIADKTIPATLAPKRRGRPPKAKLPQPIGDEPCEDATAHEPPEPKTRKQTKVAKKTAACGNSRRFGEESDYTSQKKPRKRARAAAAEKIDDPSPTITIAHSTKSGRSARARSKKTISYIELSDTEGHIQDHGSGILQETAALGDPVLKDVPDTTFQKCNNRPADRAKPKPSVPLVPPVDGAICTTDSPPIVDVGPKHKKSRVIDIVEVSEEREVIKKKSKSKRQNHPTQEVESLPGSALACKGQPATSEESGPVGNHQREADADRIEEKHTKKRTKLEKADVAKLVKREQSQPPEKVEKSKRRRRELDPAGPSGDEKPLKRILEVILKPAESQPVLASSRTQKENSRKTIKQTTRQPVKRAAAKRGASIPKNVLDRIRKTSHQLDDEEPDPINFLS
ncbi:hypothetical protein BD779DRAFT_1521784 [Infundibulicybe gibba]|nr:hypothetical protein BD779DRAFT_1521784 [Infundibulicybe gibba]